MNLPVSIGEILEGKYRIERVIGEGGMGVVVAAEHLTLRQPVAIKFLRVHQEPTLRERFLREARAASRIASDHVARVYDVGALADGTPYMVMELLHGQDLDELVRETGPLPVPRAVTFLLQACEALAEAHSAGIVHRDLKPANLFLAQRPDGREVIKLLDFGVSKQLADLTESPNPLTNTNSILGSPQFMAPEQLVSSRDVDRRADIWSLGVVLHELLTARPAFPAPTVVEMYSAILRDEPERVRTTRPDVPAELETIILRCLEKDAELRFATIGELAEGLAPFAPPDARVSAQRVQRVMDAVAPTMVDPASAAPVPAPPAGSHSGSGTLVTPDEPEPETLERPLVVASPPAEPAAATLPSSRPTVDPAVTPMPQTTGAPVVLHQSTPPLAPPARYVPPASPAPTHKGRRRWPWALAAVGAVAVVAGVVTIGIGRQGGDEGADDETATADDDEAREPPHGRREKPDIRESRLLDRAERRRTGKMLSQGEELARRGKLDEASEVARRVLDRLGELGLRPGMESATAARAQGLLAIVEVARVHQILAAGRALDMTDAEGVEPLSHVLAESGHAAQAADQAITSVGLWGPPALIRCTLNHMAKVHAEVADLYVTLAERRARHPSTRPDDSIVGTLITGAKGHLEVTTSHLERGSRMSPETGWCTAALRTTKRQAGKLAARLARVSRGRPGLGD